MAKSRFEWYNQECSVVNLHFLGGIRAAWYDAWFEFRIYYIGIASVLLEFKKDYENEHLSPGS